MDTAQEQVDAGPGTGASRRITGWFPPGVSGNPGGRPRKTPAERRVEKLSRAEAQAAVERLMGPAIARVEKALKSTDEQLALRAALDVLDRGLGKATQRIEGHISAESVTTVTPLMLRMAAQRLLSLQPPDVVEVEEVQAPEQDHQDAGAAHLVDPLLQEVDR